MDRSIRGYEELLLGGGKKVKPKKLIIRTFGSPIKFEIDGQKFSYCESNNPPLIIEMDLSPDMWKKGVAKITIGKAVAYADINELISYLRVGV